MRAVTARPLWRRPRPMWNMVPAWRRVILKRPGLSAVMGGLVLGRGQHSEGAVEAAVVVPVDPAGCGVLDVG